MHYSLFYWLIWLALMPLVIKYASLGKELICIVTYSFLGLALYFLIPLVRDAFLGKVEDKRAKEEKTQYENRRKLLKEQRLIKKCRYIKLNAKENIVNSNLSRSDKQFLLETIHGCPPDEARQLLDSAEGHKDKK